MTVKGTLWLIAGIIAIPAVASGGTICPLERQVSDAARLGDQARELRQDLSSYRYEGSLWEERRSDFYLDNKARRINDIVTIKIAEISNASQQVSTKASRDTNILAGIVKFLCFSKLDIVHHHQIPYVERPFSMKIIHDQALSPL